MRWNVAVAALAASWGFISIIAAGVDLDAAVLVFFRVGLAALTVAVGVLALRRPERLRPRGRALPLVVAGAFLGAHWFLFFETIKLASVVVALLTVYTAPIFLALLAPAFLPERRSVVALVALPPAAAGIALVAFGGGGEATVRPAALATGIAAAVTYAGLVIAGKRLLAELPVATITVWTYAVAAIALAPFLAAGGRILPRGDEIVYVLLLGVVFTGINGVIYYSLLRRVTAQALGILAFVEPVSATLLAWAILGQELTWQAAVGGALVLAAGVVVVLREPTDAPVPEAPVRIGA